MSKIALRSTLISASIAALSLIAAPSALAENLPTPAAVSSAMATASSTPNGGGGTSVSHGWTSANAIYVHGTGLNLTGAIASHDHSPSYPKSVCNIKVKFYGTLADGYKHSMTTSQSNGCGYLRQSREIGINSNIRWMNNSNFCAKVYAEGQWLPGEPCIRVHR